MTDLNKTHRNKHNQLVNQFAFSRRGVFMMNRLFLQPSMKQYVNLHLSVHKFTPNEMKNCDNVEKVKSRVEIWHCSSCNTYQTSKSCKIEYLNTLNSGQFIPECLSVCQFTPFGVKWRTALNKNKTQGMHENKFQNKGMLSF